MPGSSTTHDDRRTRSRNERKRRSATSRSPGRNEARGGQSAGTGALERVVPDLAGPIRVACFWTAIVLPFLHVPLVATGLSSGVRTVTFLLLVALNVLALYVGRSHRR